MWLRLLAPLLSVPMSPQITIMVIVLMQLSMICYRRYCCYAADSDVVGAVAVCATATEALAVTADTDAAYAADAVGGDSV